MKKKGGKIRQNFVRTIVKIKYLQLYREGIKEYLVSPFLKGKEYQGNWMG